MQGRLVTQSSGLDQPVDKRSNLSRICLIFLSNCRRHLVLFGKSSGGLIQKARNIWRAETVRNVKVEYLDWSTQRVL